MNLVRTRLEFLYSSEYDNRLYHLGPESKEEQRFERSRLHLWNYSKPRKYSFRGTAFARGFAES